MQVPAAPETCRAHDEPETGRCRNDLLAPVRGLMVGIALSALLWAGIFWLIF